MADNLGKRPSKGILKNSSSFDKPDGSKSRRESKGTKWDEMNIIATLHPADKDYGHMKIDEPKTPYNYSEDSDHDELDANVLAEKIKTSGTAPPKYMQSADNETDEDDEDLTPEEKARRKEFLAKRKKHYNEYYAVKLARKKLEEELSEDDDDENNATGTNEQDGEHHMEVENMSRSPSHSPSPTHQCRSSEKKCCSILRSRAKSPQP